MEVLDYNRSFQLNNSDVRQTKQEVSALFDSGFDSILLRDNDTFNSVNASPIHLHPPTPSKRPCYGTPSKRQIIDLNGIYYSSIRSPSKSPQNYLATGTYVHERDASSVNLLRSPVVIDQPTPIAPGRIIRCKPFVTSTQEDEKPELKPKQQQSFTTPSQDEFIQLLYKNHLPWNPEGLIGRHMGLEHVDIVTELQKRSMHNVMDVIMKHLGPSDYASMYRVSKTWKHVVQSDKKMNRERVKFLKYKREYIQATKENIANNDSCDVGGLLYPLKKNKRISNGAFSILDINCLNNSSSSLISDFYQMDIDCNKTRLSELNLSAIRPAVSPRKMFKKTSLNLDYTSPTKKIKYAASPEKSDFKIIHKSQHTTQVTTTKICSLKSKKNLKRL